VEKGEKGRGKERKGATVVPMSIGERCKDVAASMCATGFPPSRVLRGGGLLPHPRREKRPDNRGLQGDALYNTPSRHEQRRLEVQLLSVRSRKGKRKEKKKWPRPEVQSLLSLSLGDAAARKGEKKKKGAKARASMKSPERARILPRVAIPSISEQGKKKKRSAGVSDLDQFLLLFLAKLLNNTSFFVVP